MPEQIVCVRDTKVTKFSDFAPFVEKIEEVELVYWIVVDYTQRTKNTAFIGVVIISVRNVRFASFLMNFFMKNDLTAFLNLLNTNTGAVVNYTQRTKILLTIARILINPTFRKLIKQL